MNIRRLLEILIYEIIDIIPNLILAFSPFQNNLRFSKLQTGIIICSLYIMVVFTRIIALGNVNIAAVSTILWVVQYLLFYKISIRAEITKLLFVLFIILNYGSFVSICFSYLVYYYLNGANLEPYSFQASAALILVQCVTYPIFYWIMAKKLPPLMEFSENKKIWKFLWLVPATFCLSYYYNLFSNGGVTAFSYHLHNLLFSIAMNAGALFVTYMIIRLVEESNENLKLKIDNYQLAMQRIQYENLKSHIEEARCVRHDMRQNMTVIQSYLDNNNYKGLKEYLKQYFHTFSFDTPIVYCDNYAVNALIVYYADIAKKKSIDFRTDIQYPSDCKLLDLDAVVLFGNLLENALEACERRKKEGSFAYLCIKNKERIMVITLDNSFNGEIHKTKDTFLSSKGNRIGIGIISIQRIAEKYHGTVKFEYEKDIFYSSILLNL